MKWEGIHEQELVDIREKEREGRKRKKEKKKKETEGKEKRSSGKRNWSLFFGTVFLF